MDKSTEVRLMIINQIERLESMIRIEMFAMHDFSLLPLQEMLLNNLKILKDDKE